MTGSLGLLGASWDLLGRSWVPLGASWGALGASWAPLGLKIRKNLNGISFVELNLGAKIDEKSKKIDVKKALVLRHGFFIDFLRFCMDWGPPNGFGPNLAMKPKTSIL